MGKLRLIMVQVLVKFFDNQYLEVDGVELKFVKGIFVIFGYGNVLGLGQVLEQDSGDMCVYQGCNEQGMVYVVIGFVCQVLCWQIIVCIFFIGSGVVNMIIVVGIVSVNCILLLLLLGDVFVICQLDLVFQQIEQSYDFSISINDVFCVVSKYWDCIICLEQLMSVCINVMCVLIDLVEIGVVMLCLLQDVQGEVWDYLEFFFVCCVYCFDWCLVSVVQLVDVVVVIKVSCKLLIVCGGGVKYFGVGEVLFCFVECYGVFFVEIQVGKGMVVLFYFLNVGGVGEMGCLVVNLLVKEVDLVIGVGICFSDFIIVLKWIFQYLEVCFLNINVSNFDVWKLDGIVMLVDVWEVMIVFDVVLVDSGWQVGWGVQIESVQSCQLKEIQCVYQVVWQEKFFVLEIDDYFDCELVYCEFCQIIDFILIQSSVFGVLNEMLLVEVVIVVVVGSLSGDLQCVWCNCVENIYYVEYGYFCMGYEVNVVLGVKLVQLQSEVYFLVGDGLFMMLYFELVIFLQEWVKINVVLFDNMVNGCINNLQMEYGMDSFGIEFCYCQLEIGQLQGGLVLVDFVIIVVGYGCKIWCVIILDELCYVLDVVCCEMVSILIDIKVLLKIMVYKYGSWWNVGVVQMVFFEWICKVV